MGEEDRSDKTDSVNSRQEGEPAGATVQVGSSSRRLEAVKGGRT